MTLLLLGFGGYFFYDGQVGYPAENKIYFMHQAFEKMGAKASEWANAGRGSLGWKAFVRSSTVEAQPDYDFQGEKYPVEVENYDLMQSNWSKAWMDYTYRVQWNMSPPDHPYDLSKIQEQWIAGYVACALGGIALFFLIRTLGRKMELDGDKITLQGKVFFIKDIIKIDTRKWKDKGLAYIFVKDDGKQKMFRVDGLTYGGFTGTKGSTAEEFLQGILSQYSGEVVCYADEASNNNIKMGESKDK